MIEGIMEVVSFALACVGVAVGVWVLIDSRKDLCSVRMSGKNGIAEFTAKAFVISDGIRLFCSSVLFVAACYVVMDGVTPIIGDVLLICMAVALTSLSIIVQLTRKHVLRLIEFYPVKKVAD